MAIAYSDSHTQRLNAHAPCGACRDRHRRVAAILMVATLVVSACAGEGPARDPAGQGLTDDAGRPVSDTAVDRVVSLQPSTTELLFAIGAGDRVVGRSRWDEYPPAVADVPNVGDAIDPNIEAIAERNPDIVVLYPANANQQAEERLSLLGIETVSLRMDSLGSVPRAARILGRVTGARAGADSLATSFEHWLDSARTTGRSEIGPLVAIVSWTNPPIVIGGESFLSELLSLAGARNAFADIDAPSAQVTIESVADRDPDLLLYISEGDQLPDFFGRPEWRVVGAVRERRVVHARGSAFSWPSPRAPQAVAQLRRLLREAQR